MWKIMSDRNTRAWRDLDLNFSPHPVTGDVSMRYDVDAIKNSVKNLILTNNYERPFHPEIGSSIRKLLFENATPMLSTMIEKSIAQTISNFEPRVILTNVIADIVPDNNNVYVTINFQIVNVVTIQTLNLILNRTR